MAVPSRRGGSLHVRGLGVQGCGVRQKFLHMLWLGSPAGNKACHDAPGARGIGLHLQLGTTSFVEGAAFFGRHPEKLLVACGGEIRLKARCD